VIAAAALAALLLLVPELSGRSPSGSEPQPLSRIVDYEPAWSPDGSHLAFVSNRLGPLKVFSMRADGTEVRQLTQGKEEDDAPAWSPDGSRIAYVSTRDGNPEIYVMRADGTDPRRLTRDPAADIHPVWSPDGAAILWNSSRNSADPSSPDVFELFTMRPDGSDVRPRTHGGVATYASWSPDGSRLLFRQMIGENSEIVVAAADGSGPSNLTRHPDFDGWPSWSPDGRQIVFARERGEDATILVMNADGSGVHALVELSGRCTNPRWSPQGDLVVFSRRADRQIRLWTVNPRGTAGPAPTARSR
jgi:TolB protein